LEVINLATNLAINDELLRNALEIGGYKSKKDTVNAALEEFIQRRRSEDVISLFGKVEYDEKYDYKELRSR
jgi:Bacterial antitoxin of type II TA system, VapB